MLVYDYWKDHSLIQTLIGKVISLLFNTLSRSVIAFLMRRLSAEELVLSNCGAGEDS